MEFTDLYGANAVGDPLLRQVCRLSLSADSCIRQTEGAFARYGAALWAGSGLALGVLFHRQIDWLLGRLAELGGIGLIVLAAAPALYVAFRFVDRWRRFRACGKSPGAAARGRHRRLGRRRAENRSGVTVVTVGHPGETKAKRLPATMKAPRKESPVKSLVLAVFLTWSALLHAADPSQPHILVAKPELRDVLYGASILVVKPIGGDQHVGFIVNRPTGIRLGKVFPEHGPSQKIIDPVYLGGPIEAGAIFALVRRPDSPGGNSLEVLPGLYAAFEEPVVDRIIESEADRARFVAGLVVWRPVRASAVRKEAI